MPGVNIVPIIVLLVLLVIVGLEQIRMVVSILDKFLLFSLLVQGFLPGFLLVYIILKNNFHFFKYLNYE